MKIKSIVSVLALLLLAGLAHAQLGGTAVVVPTAPPYGTQGSIVPFGPATEPSYETVNLVGANQYSWAPDHNTWYNATNIRFVVILTDGATHRVSMFFQDYDHYGRNENVFVTDSNGNQLTETNVANFANGEYLSWNITGAVVINVTNNGGLNSVAGGLFLDPASTGAGGGGGGSTTATAAFVQTIQIGADGALSPTSLGTLPSYATLNTTANVYDWPSGQATWYGYPSFSFDLNLTDGKTHKITLYAIDFDTTSRAETITVADAVSGAALATQSISSFHSGVYLVFNVSGHVTITVTCTAGINAVIAGVYFN